jgi:hypothetical protein
MIACSTNVDGSSTGSLTSALLPMEARSFVGLDVGETGDLEPPALRCNIDSHSMAIERRSHLFRHCFRCRDSAEEESDQNGSGEMGDGEKGDAPRTSPASGKDASASPARSADGDEIAQNRPGRRPNGSPLISLPISP